MLFGKNPRLAPIRIPDTATEEKPNPNLNTNPNPNSNPNDLINVISHEHNDLINIMSSSMLFFTDIRLAPIRIPDTATEEAPNLNPNPNPNPKPKTNPKTNDFINVTSHEHNDLINIITSSMLFGKNLRIAPIRIPDTATYETPNLNPNPNPNPNDLINTKSHEHNDLINIMSYSMLFLNDPPLAPIRIPHTATEETPKLNNNPNRNNNANPYHHPNDLIKVTSHEHNDLKNKI